MGRALRWVVWSMVGAIALVLGAGWGLLRTEAGRSLVARIIADAATGAVTGGVTVGDVSGSFWTGVTLTDVVVRDRDSQTVAILPRIDVRYWPVDFLGGRRIVLRHLALTAPEITLATDSAGRFNLAELVRRDTAAAPTGPPPLVVFYQVAIRGGHVALNLHGEESRTVDSLEIDLAELRVSTPDEPGVGAVVRHLALSLSDPPVRLRDLRGEVRIAGDSLTVRADRLAFGGSQGRGTAVVRWPESGVGTDIALDLVSLAPQDVAFASSVVPRRGTARGGARVTLGADGTLALDLRDFEYVDGEALVRGRLAFTARGEAVTLDAVELETVGAELDLVRPLLDTLPFAGTLTGRTELRGPLDALEANVDWRFRDSAAEGAISYLTAQGRVALGGEAGLWFDAVEVQSASIALATVTALVPAFNLQGHLGAFGSLGGEWRNATFTGTLEHRDGARPASVARGRVRLDLRGDEPGFDVDAEVDPLELDGLRGSYPDLQVGGTYFGRVALTGSRSGLAVDGELAVGEGEGRVQAILSVTDTAIALRDLSLRLRAVDPSRLWPGAPPGAVSLTASGSLEVPDTGPPAAVLTAAAGPSKLAGTLLDTLQLELRAEGGLVTIDRLEGRLAGMRVAGDGTLGWRSSKQGRFTMRAVADSLAALDSLARWALGVAPDTVPRPPLSGAGAVTLIAEGPWDSLALAAEATLSRLEWLDVEVSEAAARWMWQPGAAVPVQAEAEVDSLTWGRWGAGGLELAIAGAPDDLGWRGRGRLGRGGGLVSGGRWARTRDTTVVTVDSLRTDLPTGVWTLRRSGRLTASADAVVFDRLELAPLDGDAVVAVEGRLPRAGRADWHLEARQVQLVDLYALLQFDTAGLGGVVDAQFGVGGTARAPTMGGRLRLADGRFGAFRAPLLEGTVDYRDRRLVAELGLWAGVERSGEPILAVEAELPLNLALVGAPRRKLPGAVSVSARADRVDMAVLEAMTTLMRDVSGTFSADVGVTGSWEAPALTGQIAIRDGAATFPPLNVRYEDWYGELVLRGDTIVVDRMAMRSGGGSLTVEGRVRLVELTTPRMDLDVFANRFRAFDLRDQVTLTASGRVRLTGPFIGAQLTGSATADEGVLYFKDLVEKRVVNLEDPLAQDLLPLEEIRRRGLERPLQIRLLDSLRIRDLRLQMGSDVWLRSGEANVQLTGQLSVNKERGAYRLDGTLNAERGTYRLPLRVATREFTVTSGTVRYFGTPDLNAELDLTARHLVSTVPTDDAPEQITIEAHIGGTLLVPRLTLTSDVRPPLSETEIISYMLFGRPSFQLAASGGPGANQQFVVQQVTGLLSGELERALVSDLRIPLDYIELRPGDLGSGPSVARAGVQLGRKTFVIVSAAYCPQGQWLAPGATLQYRFSRQFRSELSAEPVNQCRRGGVTTVTQQIGFDLFWERSY